MFDKTFFEEVLGQHVAKTCPMQADEIPVVLVHLADGAVLDVCHVAESLETWIALLHFSQVPECERMDLSFVRYETIVRITVSPRSRTERKVGFSVGPSAPSPSRAANGPAQR